MADEIAAPAAEAAPVEPTAEADIDTGEDIIAEAAKTPEVAKSLKKLFKLKVDGEEFDEEFDPSDDEAVKKHLQMSKVAQKRMNETAQVQKDMKELVKLLQTTPDAVLAELGINVEEFATNVLNKKLDDMKKSPEQKELEKLREEAQKERGEKEKLKQEKEQSDMLRLQEKARQEFNDELKAALENEPDLPQNAYVTKRVADLMIFALENNIKATVKEILPIVKKEIHSEWFDMFSKMPEDVLHRVVGPDNFTRVRKSILKKQKEAGTTPQSIVSTGISDTKNVQKEKEKVKASAFFNSLGRK